MRRVIHTAHGSNSLLNNLRDLIYERLGIHISKEKEYMLEAKLNRMIKKEQFGTVKELYTSLKNGDHAAQETLIKYITTNHTFFFREHEQFEVLVELIRGLPRGTRPLIWCAAASTGEEVYSLVIHLLENHITDFFMVASDVNTNVLAQLHRGIYHKNRLEHTEPWIIDKYFTRAAGDTYKIDKRLRRYFVIKKINLIENTVFDQQFDFIFCRNVLIYFDERTRERAIDNMLYNLKRDGVLFVGQSEALVNVSDRIRRIANSVYRKVRG